MAKNQRTYTVARKLGISRNTVYTWVKRVWNGELDIGNGAHKPTETFTLNEELIQARKQIKAQEKEIHRLKEENAFLEEASAFSPRSV